MPESDFSAYTLLSEEWYVAKTADISGGTEEDVLSFASSEQLDLWRISESLNSVTSDEPSYFFYIIMATGTTPATLMWSKDRG